MEELELNELLTYERFCVAFNSFLKQAELNNVSKLAEGKQVPKGLEQFKGKGKFIVSGGSLGQTYGQGAARKAPYFNWYIVSIYYIVDEAKIRMGISRHHKYSHINEMDYICYVPLPDNKKLEIALFYETSIKDLDLKELYDNFMKVSNKVIDLGLI